MGTSRIFRIIIARSNPARYTHLFHDPLKAATERVGAVITAPALKLKLALKRGQP